MDKELLELIIELVITIAAFLLGRYVLPNIKANIQDAATEFSVLLSYASSYVSYAKQFLDCNGSSKMDDVVEKLKRICAKYNIEVDEETLRAIGQKAYDAMKAGEASAEVLKSATKELASSGSENKENEKHGTVPNTTATTGGSESK